MKYFLLVLTVAFTVSSAMALTPEEKNALIAQIKGAKAENALIVQAQAALAAHNWSEAERLLKQMSAADPNKWPFPEALGQVYINEGRYREALTSYDHAIALAEKDTATDAAKRKAALAEMWVAKGNAFIKLKNNTAALAAFQKSAALSDKPAVAYFNLCATFYNLGRMKEAVPACDKSIAADPNRADAYFIKGSALFGDATLDAKGKMVVPPAALAALRKYLALAPKGGHAADVKEMLKAAGQPLLTTYQKTKK